MSDASGTLTGTLVVEPAVGMLLRLSSPTVAGGKTVNLTVELADPAPATGATVALSADSTSVVVPATVKVAAGSRTATLVLKTVAVVTDKTVRIAGTVNGSTDRVQLLVIGLRPQKIVFTPAAVLGGKSSSGTLTLTGAAPAGGLSVQLSSDNGVATVPATVVVPTGLTSVKFTVTTTAVGTQTPVTITATANGGSVGQALAVQALTVQTVTLKPTTVVGGVSSVGTIKLNGVAPAGGLQVDVTSSSAGVYVPAKVFVPAGKSVVTFTATTTPVGSALDVTLTAGANGNQVTAVLRVVPVAAASIVVTPSTVVGGDTATGTVTLVAAPGIDTVVTLTSANTAVVSVPATVTVKKGATSASFTVTTNAPASSTTVTLSATTGGVPVT
ncbi:MAG: hypothetical protein ACOVT5_07410, partial [Armatimonadaceae bacterium]